MAEQLIKKTGEGHSNVMPKSWIEAITDKSTGESLTHILQGFNMYFLSYTGNTEQTRCQVPKILRKKGLWITYVKYDGNVYTEWYNSNNIDDKSWGNSSNWRIGNNELVGDLTISANGNWVINGNETEFKAIGEKGNTPLIRIADNKLQVSYDGGDTYNNVSDNPVYTQIRTYNNKLQISTDLGANWIDASDEIAAYFRFNSGQGNNVGNIQISRNNKDWSNLSGNFVNNLHISKYIGADETLPTSGIAEGTIYAKGPTYAESDTSHNNPIYRLWVYAYKGNTLAWQDNGEFTSINAGIVQELGDSKNLVMSQKCVSQEIIQGGVYDVSAHNNDAVFESLQALLSSPNLSTLIPPSVQHGGMSIKFIQGSVPNSDNKYVQYRLIADEWSTNVANWQGVDEEPILLSNSVIKSDGVAKFIEPLMTLDNLHTRGGFLSSSGSMVEIDISLHLIISVNAGDVVVVRKGQNNGFLCFLKNYVEISIPTNYNSYICSGESRKEFADELKEFTAPSDAKYLYVAISNAGTDVVPSVLTVNGIDYISGLYNQISKIKENVDKGVDVAKYLSNDMTFNSIVRELYVLGVAYSDIKYYSVTYANGIYTLHLMDETHHSLINFLINSKGIQKYILGQIPIGSLVEGFALIDNDKLKVIPDTSVTLNYGNNLYYAPSILSHILIENENSLRQIDLTNNSVGYVNANGTITNHANSRHCDSVTVKKGDIVRVHAGGVNGTYVISYCDKNQTIFEPVVPYSGVDNDDYIFISQKDGFITISWHIEYQCYATIISSKVYRELVGNRESAYQIAVDNGFEGTEQEWLDSLKGADGAPGIPGIRGEQGLQGNSGYSGAAGELEVVNNLSDGGATKALSAEQGKLIGNFIDYNNIPIIPKRVNPDPIAIINPNPSNWTNLDSDGTVSSSTVDVYDEVYSNVRNCVELNDNNSGRFAANFSSAIDFTNKVLRMSICLQKNLDVTKLYGLAILLYSNGQTDASHRAQFTEQYANPSEGGGTYNLIYVRAGWFHFCVNPQPILSSVGSSFDITNVTDIGVHASSMEPIKVYVSEVSVVRTMLQKGIINIVDNFDPNVPNMADYASSKGVKLNLSIVPNWIGGSASASLAEINRCKRQGHFIFNHTFNHITDVSGLTEQQIVEEITKSNSWMVKNGFARGAKCISNPSAAFPFSKYKAYMESPADIIFHHWTTMPSSGKLLYYPYYPMSRLLSISALDSNSSNHTEAQATLQKMKMAIDTADTYGGIAVIGSHGTFWSADDGETWKELIDYIATKTDMISFGIDDVIEGNFV